MTSIEEQIRQAFDKTEPIPLEEVRRRAGTASRRPGPTGYRVTTALVAAALVAAAIAIPLVVVFHRSPSPVASGRGQNRTPAQSRYAVRVAVRLDTTTVRAGTEIHGTTEIWNETGHRVVIDACAADGWFIPWLRRGAIENAPASPLIVCPPSVSLHPGLNRFALSVSTRYASCTMTQGHGSPDTPHCATAGDRTPPLPAGRYAVRFTMEGLPRHTEHPAPLSVTLLPAGGSA